ncbi:MAG: ABC transporter ATP-binding protein [Syntrophorhabdaceae bacterium]|nr:ABC transporter ATP-binding protein [Syntrophorhabdaceae bacterium]HNQ63268.1 ABC transporter ATP-binding protein [Syntrophorhabdaceae bacterium]
MEIIAARNLTKHYNSLKAVDAINFTIFKGECFGFLGPNGAGKTTVMRMLYCFLIPTNGDINIFGLSVIKHPSAIKSRIGVMPQDDNLDLELTVFENLIAYARYFDIPKSRSSRIARELIEYAGLSEKAHVNIKNLSGGMKRSLLLARALINNPELLILDEPTTGLDPHTRHNVWDKLDALKAKSTTLILTTHYMEEAERLCDRVAIMDSGRIITIESPGRLMDIHGGNLEYVYLKLTGKRLGE